MAYTPATPYPKGRGDAIRSADWNEAVNELIRLENEKFNRTGGTVSGNLTVTGTVSGTLANNIVGNNQIAANAVTNQKIADLNVTTGKIADLGVTTGKIADLNVTTGKIADSGVTGQKIAPGTISVDKLVGGSHLTAANVTLGATVGSVAGIFISGEFLDTTPPPAISLPLLFVTTPTNSAIFRYHLEFRRFLSGTRPFGGFVAWFTNEVAVLTEIQLSSYILRRP